MCRLLTSASANAQGKPDWREQVEFGVEQQPVDGAFGADRPLWERLIGVKYVKRAGRARLLCEQCRHLTSRPGRDAAEPVA